MRRIAVLTFLFTLFLLMGCSKGDSLLISSGKPASSNQLSEPVSSTSELVDPIELLKTISFDTSEDEIVSTCVSDINNDRIDLNQTEYNKLADWKDETSYYLPLPTFIDVPATAYCTIAQDYLRLTEEEFSNQYSAKQLWKAGAYDRLLVTSTTKGPIIEDISIGDSLEKIENRFGKSQFSTESEYNPNATNYQRFLLYGYKTKTCYFVFQIAPDTQKVQSICLKKRFPLPQNKHDILLKLSAEHSDWYTGETNSTEWNTYLAETAVSAYTQLSRGTMTLISDYGFLSTSGMGDFYDVFADFEGKIPKLPTRPSAYHDNSCEQPVSLRKTDYPEQLIYHVYDYLAEGEFASEEKTEVLSPSGTISVTPRDQNPLSMSTNSSLYENAHLVFHWKDGSQPDRQVYMGHFSRIVGFLNERYLVESNLFGLNIYDILSENIVHYDFDLSEEYSTNFLIDSKRSVIVDEQGTIYYRYQFAENGDLQIVKSRE